MIKFLKKLLNLPIVIRSAFAIEESWDLVGRGKYNEAEVLFVNTTDKMSKLNFELEIMGGYIKFCLEKRYECLDWFEKAWNSIEQDDKLSTYDKNYLKYFMYRLIKVYYDYLDLGDRRRLGPINAEDVSLSNVSRAWKRRFPSRDHPDWGKFGAGV